ncbi:MAG TPA: hypothetical protein VI997_01310 [Candidatus Thermoplasmatota archaeon]|nr:hypothetical protein [Candidatus Thermoplasmatota archaeon]
MAAWLEAFLTFDVSEPRLYALFFLLGSFAVATVSDVKHLAAQREFLEVWAAFAVVVFVLDVWLAEFEPTPWLLAKWALIPLLSLLSWEKVGPFLHLALGDVCACAAAASLLPPGLVVAFYLVLKVTSYPAASLLARGRSHYPFMPVVTFATVAVLAWALWLGPWIV